MFTEELPHEKGLKLRSILCPSGRGYWGGGGEAGRSRAAFSGRGQKPHTRGKEEDRKKGKRAMRVNVILEEKVFELTGSDLSIPIAHSPHHGQAPLHSHSIPLPRPPFLSSLSSPFFRAGEREREIPTHRKTKK